MGERVTMVRVGRTMQGDVGCRRISRAIKAESRRRLLISGQSVRVRK